MKLTKIVLPIFGLLLVFGLIFWICYIRQFSDAVLFSMEGLAALGLLAASAGENSRKKLHAALVTGGKIFVLIIFMLSAYKMVDIALPYLVPPFPTDIDFLQSKQMVVDKPHYMIAFYLHISTSVIALTCGLTQFSKTIMFKYPKVHQTIGKIYVFLILIIAAPSGLVMAFYGNGGKPAVYAFILQALGWWWLTFMAYKTIREKRFRNHGEYMLRSYAMAMSAISLRAMSYVIFALKDYHSLRYPDSYIMIAWVSWTMNLVIAELLIMAGLMNYYLGKPREEKEERTDLEDHLVPKA